MSKQTIILYFILSLAVLLSTALCLRLPLGEVLRSAPSDNKMDGFMSNASYVQTDSRGALQTEVSALRIEHFPGQNTSLFHYPSITVYNSQWGSKRQPWHITADKGIAELGVNKIHLKDNVKIEQQPTAKTPFTTFLTTYLDIVPAQKTLETQAPVTILQPGMVVKSKGLKADMQRGTIQLLSKAYAHFEAFKMKQIPKEQ